jgi:putative thioredoxin
MSRIFDATSENFAELVIQGSASRYILVDFWAPWCNPCQQLKPMLEALTAEYDFTLVKVNTEEEQEIAAQMAIRGIPDVRLYKEGVEVDRFSGALPEAEVRTFLEKHLPSALDGKIEAAMAQAAAGDGEEATAAFNALLGANPESGKVKLAAARYLIAAGKGDDAMTVLRAIKPGEAEYNTAQAMLAMGELHQACSNIENSEGLDRLYAEAACATVAEEYEKAFDTFLQIILKDKGYNDGAARKAMVILFDALGRDNPMVQTYTRRLAMYLH